VKAQRAGMTTKNTDGKDKKRMLKFIADDAQWHYARRREILKRDPSIKKYFRPMNISVFPLLLIVIFRAWLVIKAALYIGALEGYLAKYFTTLLFVLGDQWLFHCGMTFAHEHSHNLIFDSPLGVVLVDIILDWHSTSFAEGLKYVYSHSRFHHPNLGDPATDSELENKDFPGTQWNALIYFGQILFPGLLFLDILTKQKVPGKCKNTDFKVPKSWLHRKIACYIASICSLAFLTFHGGFAALAIQIWSIGLYISPYSIWRKGQSIAEHLTNFNDPSPTYSSPSYFINIPFFNTGLHDEHHTFPLVPWYHLRTLRNKFPHVFNYDQHTSYERLWFNWLMNGCPNYRDPQLASLTETWFTIPSFLKGKKAE